MPTETTHDANTRDVSGMVMAAIFILLAAVALWDTTNMADADSYVFPRAVAIAMIAFSLMLIVWNLVRPTSGDGTGVPGASTPRRVGLVAAMLIGTLLMPYLGFVPSGLLAFGAIMLFAMYDSWTRNRLIVYPLVGISIVIGFYTIFAKVLLVPLPTSLWFE